MTTRTYSTTYSKTQHRRRIDSQQLKFWNHSTTQIQKSWKLLSKAVNHWSINSQPVVTMRTWMSWHSATWYYHVSIQTHVDEPFHLHTRIQKTSTSLPTLNLLSLTCSHRSLSCSTWFMILLKMLRKYIKSWQAGIKACTGSVWRNKLGSQLLKHLDASIWWEITLFRSHILNQLY